jgi:hypothetical protein
MSRCLPAYRHRADYLGYADHYSPIVACGGMSAGENVQTWDVRAGATIKANWDSWDWGHRGKYPITAGLYQADAQAPSWSTWLPAQAVSHVGHCSSLNISLTRHHADSQVGVMASTLLVFNGSRSLKPAGTVRSLLPKPSLGPTAGLSTSRVSSLLGRFLLLSRVFLCSCI